MERLLITGGCGYVGRVLSRIASDSFEVHVLDNLSCGSYRLAGMDLAKITLHVADLRDETAVRKVFATVQPHVVVHLAAIHFIPACERDPRFTLDTNVAGTMSILAAAPPDCRLVFTSSAAVYAPQDGPTDETCPTGPMDVYGWSKLHGEQWCAYLRSRPEQSTWLVRLFNVIGPGETNPHILPAILSQLLKGEKILQLGNLASLRDYIDVRDAAEGFLRLAKIPSAGARVVNLGTGRTYAVSDLLDHLRSISGIDFQVHQDLSRMRAVDRPVLHADTKLLQTILDWLPARPLVDTLEELWQKPDLAPGLQA